MNSISRYLNEVKAKIAASALVQAAEIITERALLDRGYLRVRLTLSNGDFLELSEYMALEAETLTTVEYRYQWMDAEQARLIKRWDNARHFPHLANFPHHLHLSPEDRVIPGNPMNILELIEVLEQELTMIQE